jgi:hypothetical protein
LQFGVALVAQLDDLFIQITDLLLFMVGKVFL